MRNNEPATGNRDSVSDFGQVLWTPSSERLQQSNLTRFSARVGELHGVAADSQEQLYEWSIKQPQDFWSLLWDFGEVIGDKGDSVLVDAHRMPGARWFPEARLNFAENLLRKDSDDIAIIFRAENTQETTLTFSELKARVAATAAALRASGVVTGDRVAGYLPNLPDSIIAMLASASIGAVWSSCSPDFGAKGVLDRFGQIEPKVLFAADGYFYNGKTIDCLPVVLEFAQQIDSLQQLVIVGYTRSSDALEAAVSAAFTDSDFIPGNDNSSGSDSDHHDHANERSQRLVNSLDNYTSAHSDAALVYERLPFDHPLYIMYSSGTTGVPKCIVHGAGGTLLQHIKELSLHTDVKAGDRLFYFTTCGWMMWNWLVSGLSLNATLMLFDGAPFHPDANALFDFASKHRMSIFGTSAKFIDACAKAGLKPLETHDLSALKSMLSTGSPLVPESFDYVYKNIKTDLCLSSISGGTDIVSCFALGSPNLPVRRGELQCRGLALQVDVFDDNGKSVREQKGELVCLAPFPSMPVGFWNDPDGKRYSAAYFERFEGVWCHGDYVALTQSDGLIIYGRSDAVLNPGGVRIGTAEIYRQVEQFDEVIESLVVGQRDSGDIRVVLFVRLRDGIVLSDELTTKIKNHLRDNATPRHVPAVIIAIADIPRTKSGKIVELAVQKVVHGEVVANRDALANPEALELYRDLPQLNQ